MSVNAISSMYSPYQNIGVKRQQFCANPKQQLLISNNNFQSIDKKPKEKKGLSNIAKFAIIAGGIGALMLADSLIRGKSLASKTVIKKIESLLKNKKVQDYCKKNNIDTDINKIKGKSTEKQLEFLEDLFDIVVTVI